jgi:hypothetical protein
VTAGRIAGTLRESVSTTIDSMGEDEAASIAEALVTLLCQVVRERFRPEHPVGHRAEPLPTRGLPSPTLLELWQPELTLRFPCTVCNAGEVDFGVGRGGTAGHDSRVCPTCGATLVLDEVTHRVEPARPGIDDLTSPRPGPRRRPDTSGQRGAAAPPR